MYMCALQPPLNFALYLFQNCGVKLLSQHNPNRTVECEDYFRRNIKLNSACTEFVLGLREQQQRQNFRPNGVKRASVAVAAAFWPPQPPPTG